MKAGPGAFWLTVLLLASCHRPSALTPHPPPSHAVLVLTSDLRGYLGPCGCSERMQGGIDRAAAQLEAIRREGAPVAFVDAGDALFEGVPLDAMEIPEAERRATAVAQAFLQMRVQAKALGPRDDERGVALRSALGLPEIPQPGVRTLQLAERTVALVSAKDARTMQRLADGSRAQGAQLIVGMAPVEVATAQDWASQLAGHVDLLIASHGETLGAEENRLIRAGVPVLQLQSKGRSLARIDIAFGAAGSRAAFTLASTPEEQLRALATLDARIALLRQEVNAPGIQPERKSMLNHKMDELVARRTTQLQTPPDEPTRQNGIPSLRVRFVPVESSLPSDPDVKALVDQYDRDVSGINLAWAREHGHDCPLPTVQEPGYVGNASCAHCHAAANAVWGKTVHAHAYATLAATGKQFSPHCVSCHVIGYAQPGGVCRVDHVEGRQNVGCESCHGPGSAHARKPSLPPAVPHPEVARCVQCHTKENSPHFDFALYLPKVLGPGHGRPLSSTLPEVEVR